MNIIKISIVLIAVLILSSCDIFNKDEKLLAGIGKSNGDKINVYYISVGATTKDVIQVRYENRDSILWVSDKYDSVISLKIINDTILQLVLCDTFSPKGDTTDINIR